MTKMSLLYYAVIRSSQVDLCRALVVLKASEIFAELRAEVREVLMQPNLLQEPAENQMEFKATFVLLTL